MNRKHHLPFLLLLILAVTVFWPWFQPGFLSNGDWWHILPSRAREYFDHLLIWDGARNLGSPLSNSTAHYGIHWFYGFLQEYFNISTSISARIFWFIPFIIFSFTGGWVLATYFTKRALAGLIGAIVFTLNTFALTTVAGGQMTIAVSYALAPLSLISFLHLIETKRAKYAYGLGFLVFLQAIYDVRMLAITIFAGFFLAFINWYLAKPKSEARRLPARIKLVITALVTFFLLSAYWIIPLLASPGGSSAGVPTSHTNVGWVSALSYSTLANALAANHVWWPFSDGELNPIQPLFYIVTILAVVAFFNWRKDKRVIGLFSLLMVGFFLTKGSNEPLSNVYEWMFVNVPGFILFRDPAKFYLMIMLAVTPLSAMGAVYLIDKINFRWRKILTLSIFILLLVPLYPALTNQLKGTFIPKQIPAEYQRFATFYEEKDWGRTMWLPTAHRYAPYTQEHAGINSGELTANGWSYFLDETGNVESFFTHPYAQKVVSNSGVRWVGLPFDTDNEIYRHYQPFSYYENIFNAIPWLKRIDSGLRQIAIYENKYAKPEIYSASSVVAIDKEVLRQAPLEELREEDLLLLTSRTDSHTQFSNKERVRTISIDKEDYEISTDSMSWQFNLPYSYSGKLVLDNKVANVPIYIDDVQTDFSANDSATSQAGVNLSAGEHRLTAVFGNRPNILPANFADINWGICQDQRSRPLAPDNFYFSQESQGKTGVLNIYSTEESPGCAALNLGLLKPGVYRLNLDSLTEGLAGPDVRILHDNGQVTDEVFEPSKEWNNNFLIFEIKEELPATLLLLANSFYDSKGDLSISRVNVSSVSIERLLDGLAGWVTLDHEQSAQQVSKPIEINSYERLAPGKYRVSLPASENPYFIILNQAYSEGWQIKGLKATEHIYANAGLNAWQVNVPQETEITIEYGSTKPYIYGLIITLITLIFTIGKLSKKGE